MNKILSLILFFVISFSLVACGSNDSVKNDTSDEVVGDSTIDANNEDNVEQDIEYNVDWDKCINDTKEEFANSEQYDYLKDIYIEVSDNKIIFTAVLTDSTDKEVALKFSDNLIRRFNANAQLQDSSIKSSGKDYLGGLYDLYSISIGVAPLSKINNSNEWYIHDVIGEKVHREPELQN